MYYAMRVYNADSVLSIESRRAVLFCGGITRWEQLYPRQVQNCSLSNNHATLELVIVFLPLPYLATSYLSDILVST